MALNLPLPSPLAYHREGACILRDAIDHQSHRDRGRTMPPANPKVESVSCPGCGAQYEFPASMSGCRGRCTQCGTEFAVPIRDHKPGPGDPLPDGIHDESAEPDSQYIGVECPRCQTRMYGLLHQVGREMKCPDCGAKTVLPPPPPSKKKNIPAAMEGEQYELWEADESPLPSVLYAHQPKYIAVTCSRCETVMYPTEKQVEQTIVCPDCNTKCVVPLPTKPQAKRDVLARDADTPKLDAAAHPGERPAYLNPSTRKMVHEEVREAEYQRALEKSRRTGKPMEIDHRGRPVMPRWPLITGILPFLFSRGVPVRWLAISFGFFAVSFVLQFGIATAMQNPFLAIPLFAGGCILALLVITITAGNLMAIVTESSEGNRVIQSWPALTDGFFELLYFAVSGTLSALPGWLLARFVLPQPELSGLCVGVSIIACFPIMLLSQLHFNSPWGLISPQIIASLTCCSPSWLLFYLESVALGVICGTVAFFTTRSNLISALLFIPLYVATLIIYMRLLGRLAWRLAEAMPADE